MRPTSVCRITLEASLLGLIRQAVAELPSPGGSGGPPLIALEIPKIRAHGDLATSAALQLASRLHRPPLEIAESLADRLRELLKASPLRESIERVEVKPPGFVNLFLSRAFLIGVLREVLRSGPRYGRSLLGSGKKAHLEFVSANPTGPLSVAHGRQAAVGDALANLLDFAGYRVTREYYVNDEGTQIDLLGASILARARESRGQPAEFPENGYKGQYVRQLGEAFAKRYGGRIGSAQARDLARAFGVRELLKVIQEDLARFGVRFDSWFFQGRLNRFRYLKRSLDLLKRRGFLYESEGAWWLRSTAFGDDKDRVVIRSDGRHTYVAADIAYHRRKFERGFDLLVNLWGPDHHGYIPRLKAAVQALGFKPESLSIRIVQLCTLKRGAETIPMSTREGEFITLSQVIEEVGRDAGRFFFLLRKTDAHLEFDLQLAKQQSLENPVYYIQYAHARISSILAYRRKQGVEGRGSGMDDELLKAPEELKIIRLLREFPGVVEMSAKSLEPFGVVSYLQELAEAFHRFYDAHRVVSDSPGLTAARLNLVQAVRTVLATGLRLLGVSAPEKM
ncbi:MAG: arginine--tRNA ligase [Candidatus Omnitrophica bacterium]|nr:arginine--tRNA ligase [Candidatus Omnitrophota bacterium]